MYGAENIDRVRYNLHLNVQKNYGVALGVVLSKDDEFDDELNTYSKSTQSVKGGCAAYDTLGGPVGGLTLESFDCCAGRLVCEGGVRNCVVLFAYSI